MTIAAAGCSSRGGTSSQAWREVPAWKCRRSRRAPTVARPASPWCSTHSRRGPAAGSSTRARGRARSAPHRPRPARRNSESRRPSASRRRAGRKPPSPRRGRGRRWRRTGSRSGADVVGGGAQGRRCRGRRAPRRRRRGNDGREPFPRAAVELESAAAAAAPPPRRRGRRDRGRQDRTTPFLPALPGGGEATAPRWPGRRGRGSITAHGPEPQSMCSSPPASPPGLGATTGRSRDELRRVLR